MPAILINSPDDPRIEVYRDLKSPQSKQRQPLFIAESLLLTERLLASRLEAVSVLTEERCADRILRQTPPDLPVYVVPKTLIKEIAGFNFHRGVLGCGRRPQNPTLNELFRSPPAHLVVAVCIGVKDPENVGGIIRTSAALGIFAVILGPNCADPFSRRVGRTSMGANFTVPILAPDDLAADLTRLRRDHGVQIIATVLAVDAEPLTDAPRPDRIAIVFGSEGFGLEPEWQDRCDDRVFIPMQSGVDSLNVSVAAGIFLHHFRTA